MPAMFYAIYFSLAVNCCSVEPHTKHPVWTSSYTTDELLAYVKQFNDLTNTTTQVPVVIVKEFTHPDGLDSSTIGVCYSLNDVGVRVELKEWYWNKFGAIEREVAVLHELIHCALSYFDHDTTVMTDGCPQSLMYPSILHPICFAKHRFYYYERVSSGYYNRLSHLLNAGEHCGRYAY